MDGRKEREEADAELDRQLEDSFPASDPPKVTRFPAGHEFTSAEDVEPAEETPEPVLPPAKDLKW